MTPLPTLLFVMLSLLLFACGEQQELHHDSSSPPVATARVAFKVDDDPRPPLEIQGDISGMWVSPDGRLWLETYRSLYTADSVWGNWRENDAPVAASNVAAMPGGDFHFNEQTAIASPPPGSPVLYPHLMPGSPIAWIRRTSNGGADWDSMPVPVDDMASLLAVTPDGDAWAGGARGTLAYSSDFGRSWRQCTPPFTSEMERGSITKLSTQIWYAVSRNNSLRRTSDAGETWSDAPTPFDSGLLPVESAFGSSAIMDRIESFGNSIILVQERTPFIFDSSDKGWARLPGRVRTFIRDPDDDRIVGVTDLGDIVAIDGDLSLTYLTSQPLPTRPERMAMAGDTLYAVDANKRIYQIVDCSTRYDYPRADPIVTPTGYSLSKRGDVWWQVSEHHLYRSHTDTSGWYHAGSLPMPISGIYPRNGNEVILINGYGGNYEFRFDEKKFYTIPGLDSAHITGIQQRDSLWIAYGGDDGSMSSTLPGFRSTDGGIYVSSDSGRTWWRADVWIGHGISAAYLTHDGYLHVVSYSGVFRSIRLAANGAAVVIDSVATGPLYLSNPGDRQLFFRGNQGWLRTWMHHSPDDHRYTSDAGRTWQSVSSNGNISAVEHFREGFLAQKENDLVYITADSIRILVDTDHPPARTYFSASPIDGNRILVNRSVYSEGFQTKRDYWTELEVR